MFTDLIPRGSFPAPEIPAAFCPNGVASHRVHEPYRGEWYDLLAELPAEIKAWLREADGATLFEVQGPDYRLWGFDLMPVEEIGQTTAAWRAGGRGVPDATGFWVLGADALGNMFGVLADGRITSIEIGRDNWRVIAASLLEFLQRVLTGYGDGYWVGAE